jgi:hypothetical protein
MVCYWTRQFCGQLREAVLAFKVHFLQNNSWILTSDGSDQKCHLPGGGPAQPLPACALDGPLLFWAYL